MAEKTGLRPFMCVALLYALAGAQIRIEQRVWLKTGLEG
jgi:hypothetical protein